MNEGINVYLEISGNKISETSLQLIAKAQNLASLLKQEVFVSVIGYNLEEVIAYLKRLDISKIAYFDDIAFQIYKSDLYIKAFKECIQTLKPKIVLIPTSDIGKSIASVALLFHSGVTADCIKLEIKDSQFLQIRPAFGGNVMATIITPNARPIFTTIRKNVFTNELIFSENKVQITELKNTFISKIEIMRVEKSLMQNTVSNAKIVFIAGNGFKSKNELQLLEQLARSYGAVLGCTRALVEKGFYNSNIQIGLSGNTIAPDIIVTFGVSGSIQFLAGINKCKKIIAINIDEFAPIFSVAHFAICSDMFEIIRELQNKSHSEIKGDI